MRYFATFGIYDILKHCINEISCLLTKKIRDNKSNIENPFDGVLASPFQPALVSDWAIIRRHSCCRKNSDVAIAATRNRVWINAWIDPSFLLQREMSGQVVRAYPPMPKLIFMKLFERNCGSVPPRCFYCLPPESLLRVYIWVRKYGLAMLAGPIVMIAAHKVAK